MTIYIYIPNTRTHTHIQLSEEEERMRLLQMIKDSSNGPEQAKRRIEELDKMG